MRALSSSFAVDIHGEPAGRESGIGAPARVVAAVAAFLLILCALFPIGAVGEALPELPGLVEHGAVMMMIDSNNGALLWANNAAVAFYGYPRQQLLQMNIGDINMLDADHIAVEMKAAREQERNFFLFRHRLSSGAIRNVEVYSYPIQYQDRSALLSIVHDVTDRIMLEEHHRRLTIEVYTVGALAIIVLAILLVMSIRGRAKIAAAKRELENQSSLRESFFNASSDMIYLKDENLRYAIVNKATERFYGKTAKQILELNDWELSGDEFAKIRMRTDKMALDKRDVIVEEVTWEGRALECTKFPVHMPSGQFGVGAYIRDITKERMEEKHREMTYRRQKILADVFTRSFQTTQEELDYVLHEALNLTGSQYGYLFLYNEETRDFSLNSWTDGVIRDSKIENPRMKFDLDSAGFWSEVVSRREPIIVNDYSSPNPLKKGLPVGHILLRRFLLTPVVFGEKIVALVGLANKPEEYDNQDEYEMKLLMNGVWNAVLRRELEDKVRFERAKYLKTLISIGDGVMVVDRGGRIEMLNPVAELLTGWTVDEARGRPYSEVFVIRHEEIGVPIADAIQDALSSGEVQELTNSAVLISRQGNRYNLEDSAAPILSEDGKVEGVVLVFRDVTNKKEQLRQIQYLSFHDPLTGLYNRRFFNEELMRLDTQRNLPISVVMGDVNGLKLTNDVFGHTAGDLLLKRIAQVFRQICRADDIIARWGGDEFVLLLPKTNAGDAAAVVGRIKAEFARQRIKAVKGSISMGVACKDTAETDILQTLVLAEEAMYVNKALEQDEARSSTIGEIIRVMHSENPRERQHAERVRALCEDFGRALNLPKEEIRRLSDAAFLHDIGKIAMDPELLNVGADMSERQWKEIRRHSIVGFRILNASDDTVDLASAVLAHHESWDGSGYPKGLKGEEIPLAARVLNICEVFDRMTHDTGEKKFSTKEAADYIRGCAGTMFDPRLVNVFYDMIMRDHDRG
jgi:diguanylate cyclase (GGDEF)-like protein/PAS domain S-box-containing protein